MMLPFGLSYQNEQLYIENVSVQTLIEQYGTPLYVYSRSSIHHALQQYQHALVGTPHRICYAVKANGHLAILRDLVEWGAGFDIVSVGELQRCLTAGADPKSIIFSGVGKRVDEIITALDVGIGCFNVESEAELISIQQCAEQMNKKAPVSLRVNPNVDPKTHPYISTGLEKNKFGLALPIAKRLYQNASAFSHIDWVGMDCHIGSQITTLEPFTEALDCLLALYDELAAQGLRLKHLDLGGGLGVAYQNGQSVPTPAQLLSSAQQIVGDRPIQLIWEPGRSIVAASGILLSQVLLTKPQGNNEFAVIDAGMNDLMRPALYQARHDIIEVKKTSGSLKKYHIVGPVCESSDSFGEDQELNIKAGEYIAILHAGAYGMSMASDYNARPKPAEVMVEGQRAILIRPRQTLSDLWSNEQFFIPRV